ncbi:hypothetical protein ACFFWB_26935 [Flavobacterium procerum]
MEKFFGGLKEKFKKKNFGKFLKKNFLKKKGGGKKKVFGFFGKKFF